MATQPQNSLGSLCKTSGSLAPTVLRLALGVTLFPHGAQKLLGWFGGYGFHGTMGYFTSAMHLPYVLALLVILTEFFGPLALILGVFTRFAALATGFNILVAALMVHVSNGFFMNWSGTQKGEGIEYHLLFVAIALSLVITGGGALSVDGLLGKAPAAVPETAPAPAPTPPAATAS